MCPPQRQIVWIIRSTSNFQDQFVVRDEQKLSIFEVVGDPSHRAGLPLSQLLLSLDSVPLLAEPLLTSSFLNLTP
jgi:hypothetical protein